MSDEFYNAVIYGDIAEVKRMLEKNPTLIGWRDKYGFTALHGAAGEGNTKMIRLLVELGADVNAQNDEGISPLHICGYPKVAKVLLGCGANLELLTRDGRTPLIELSAEEESENVMKVLLDAGADANAKDHQGTSALSIATDREEISKVHLLKKFGAEVDTLPLEKNARSLPVPTIAYGNVAEVLSATMIEYGIVSSPADEKKIVKNIDTFLNEKYSYRKMSKCKNESLLKGRLPYVYSHYYMQFLKERPSWYFELYPNTDLNEKTKFSRHPEVGWILLTRAIDMKENSVSQQQTLDDFFEALLASTGYKVVVLHKYKENEERL